MALCRLHDVPYANVYNIDETMVNLCTHPDKGWTLAKKPVKLVVKAGVMKLGITVTMALPMAGPGRAIAQLTVAGESDRCHPAQPWPSNIMRDHSPSHWQTVSTLLRFLAVLQKEVGPQERCMVLLDCAPQHVAAEAQERLALELPLMHLCFVPRGCASVFVLPQAPEGPHKDRVDEGTGDHDLEQL